MDYSFNKFHFYYILTIQSHTKKIIVIFLRCHGAKYVLITGNIEEGRAGSCLVRVTAAEGSSVSSDGLSCEVTAACEQRYYSLS